MALVPTPAEPALAITTNGFHANSTDQPDEPPKKKKKKVYNSVMSDIPLGRDLATALFGSCDGPRSLKRVKTLQREVTRLEGRKMLYAQVCCVARGGVLCGAAWRGDPWCGGS